MIIPATKKQTICGASLLANDDLRIFGNCNDRKRPLVVALAHRHDRPPSMTAAASAVTAGVPALSRTHAHTQARTHARAGASQRLTTPLSELFITSSRLEEARATGALQTSQAGWLLLLLLTGAK